MSTYAGDDHLQVVNEELLERVLGVDGVWREGVQPQKLCGLQGQWEVGNFCSVCAACHIDCLGVDREPLMWGCFAVVLGEADWFEAI